MATFILTWNPALWDQSETERRRDIDRTARGEAVLDRWSVGRRQHGLTDGDRAFLLLQGERRGLVGAGYFTSRPFAGEHWDRSGRELMYASVRFDALLDLRDRLATEDLLIEVPEVPWNSLRQSGTEISGAAATTLEYVWDRHLAELGFHLPEEVPVDTRYPEGAVERVLVNRYERSRSARQACIDQWGTRCHVCELDFGEVYGDLGEGFIHVHHLVELSTVGDEYEVDPAEDLRPVCANCHAMLHRTRPALHPDDLRKMLSS